MFKKYTKPCNKNDITECQIFLIIFWLSRKICIWMCVPKVLERIRNAHWVSYLDESGAYPQVQYTALSFGVEYAPCANSSVKKC